MAERTQQSLGENLECLIRADTFLEGLRRADGSRVPRNRIAEVWEYLCEERDKGRVKFREVVIDGEPYPYLTINDKKRLGGYLLRFDPNARRGVRAIDMSSVELYSTRSHGRGMHPYE